MAKRIDYQSFVGVYGDNYKITSYERLNKKHMYQVQFNKTKNVEWVTFNRIRDLSTLKDSKLIKELAKLKQLRELKMRNNITKKLKNKNVEIKPKFKYLVIDLATTRVGYCIVDDLKIKNSGNFEVTGVLNERIFKVKEYIQYLINKYKIDGVVLESIFLGLNSNVLMALSMVRGVVIGIGKPTETVSIKSWKTFHNITGTRTQQKKQSTIIASKIMNKKIVSDDEADSVLIANYLIKKMEAKKW